MQSLLKMHVFVFLLSLFSSNFAFAHGYKLGDLNIHHPWARATPIGAEVAGGYMEITNLGSSGDRLVAVEVAGVHMAAIHEMATVDGIMKMRPLPSGLEIKSGETIILKPGSFHVMMMGLSKPLLEGETISGTLHFEKADSITIEYKIEAMGSEPAGQHNHTAAPSN
jgi:copper(I)-binding protein